jgi:hypothetical protein
MDEDLDSAQRYRQRAEGLRTIAQQTFDNSTRKTLLDMAEDYERMAGSRERLAESDQKLKR